MQVPAECILYLYPIQIKIGECQQYIVGVSKIKLHYNASICSRVAREFNVRFFVTSCCDRDWSVEEPARCNTIVGLQTCNNLQSVRRHQHPLEFRLQQADTSVFCPVIMLLSLSLSSYRATKFLRKPHEIKKILIMQLSRLGISIWITSESSIAIFEHRFNSCCYRTWWKEYRGIFKHL
jgi:hypothetical protein